MSYGGGLSSAPDGPGRFDRLDRRIRWFSRHDKKRVGCLESKIRIGPIRFVHVAYATLALPSSKGSEEAPTLDVKQTVVRGGVNPGEGPAKRVFVRWD